MSAFFVSNVPLTVEYYTVTGDEEWLKESQEEEEDNNKGHIVVDADDDEACMKAEHLCCPDVIYTSPRATVYSNSRTLESGGWKVIIIDNDETVPYKSADDKPAAQTGRNFVGGFLGNAPEILVTTVDGLHGNISRQHEKKVVEIKIKPPLTIRI